jgi:hypothetical protein
MKLPRPISGSLYKGLVGALSTLAAEGKVQTMRARTPRRSSNVSRPVPRASPPKPPPLHVQGWKAAAVDAVVSTDPVERVKSRQLLGSCKMTRRA